MTIPPRKVKVFDSLGIDANSARGKGMTQICPSIKYRFSCAVFELKTGSIPLIQYKLIQSSLHWKLEIYICNKKKNSKVCIEIDLLF